MRSIRRPRSQIPQAHQFVTDCIRYVAWAATEGFGSPASAPPWQAPIKVKKGGTEKGSLKIQAAFCFHYHVHSSTFKVAVDPQSEFVEPVLYLFRGLSIAGRRSRRIRSNLDCIP